MLVALSDVHLQDTTLGGLPSDLNVSPQAFELFFQHVAAAARQNRAKEIIFLLNGDVFDLLRTERWFVGNGTARPYQVPITASVEAKLMEIWDGIERSNAATLDILHRVATGRDGFDFPVRPRFVYVAGNHDRLINISPVLRRRVHALLNLEQPDAPLPWTYEAPEYGLFVRHGHEYDWANCEYSLAVGRPEARRDERLYWETPLGDWVTLDLATYLTYRFKQLFGDHPLYEHVHQRLRRIDDVRPPSRVIPWLQVEVGDSREAYRIVADTFATVCRERRNHPFLKAWHRAHSRPLRLDRSKIQAFLFMVFPPLLTVLPKRTIRWISDITTQAHARPAWRLAAREPILHRPPFQYVLSGHFHQPQTVLLRKEGGRPYIYFCTGTWRSRFVECQQDSRFVLLNAMHYVTFFRRDEDPDHLGRPKTTSFNLWNGLAMKCSP